jgi:hypothetical protein
MEASGLSPSDWSPQPVDCVGGKHHASVIAIWPPVEVIAVDTLRVMEPQGTHQHLRMIAEHLAGELTPVLQIKGVTQNSDLLGAYVESAVRGWVRRIVQPMRVCTGAVLDYPIQAPLRQIDLIIWAPYPVPALFAVDEFGIVPNSSAFGVLEIKRSDYSGVAEKLESFLADARARKIVSDPYGPIQDFGRVPALGVIGVLEGEPSAALRALIDSDQAIAIFDKSGGTVAVRHNDVLKLINFLQFVTWRYRVHGSAPSYPELIRITDVTSLNQKTSIEHS